MTAECWWILKVLGAQQAFAWHCAGGCQTEHFNGAVEKAKSCSHASSTVEAVSVILAGELSSSWVKFSPCTIHSVQIEYSIPNYISQ